MGKGTAASPAPGVELGSADWLRLKVLAYASFLTPVVLYGVGYVMKRNGFEVPEQQYANAGMHWAMYLLFAVGTLVFFFSDGLADFVQKFVFRGGLNDPGRVARLYTVYTIWVMGLLDIITLSAFAGFFLCGNLTWLGLFAMLQFGLQFKYLPKPSRLERLLRTRNSEL